MKPRPDDKLSMKDLPAVLQMSERTLKRAMGRPDFPKPYRVSERRIVWLRRDIERYKRTLQVSPPPGCACVQPIDFPSYSLITR